MSNRVTKYTDVISVDIRSSISTRYHTVTRAINDRFWGIQDDTRNSLYVGSYGRNTAINTSDIDILVELREEEYQRYDSVQGNGQSRLLQAVRSAILSVYPQSDVRADGQIVKITFSDGMRFEILPAFRDIYSIFDGNRVYKYPDANMGGNWRATNPKAEQEAMRKKNQESNGLLYDTCKHMRKIRDNHFSSYHLSGIVIDSFVYAAMKDWRWLNSGETSTSQPGTYEQVLLDYLNNHFPYWAPQTITAPGSEQIVDINGSLECLTKVMMFIAE